jgi:hypothetical protein
MEANPVNMVIHYWHYDPDFCASPGVPKALPFDGPASFNSLVRRYAGDIPAGAMRTELFRTDTISEEREGSLVVRKRFFYPAVFHDDFIRSITFSLKNLATTVVHNADVVKGPERSEELLTQLGRFERYAWSETLTPEGIDEFRMWARTEGFEFLKKIDHWIGEHEPPREEWGKHPAKAVGIGVYYFEEDD